MAVKASIAVMLLRLMVKPIHRYIIWAVIIPTELFSIAFFFLFIFQCQPSKYFWTRYTGGSGHCIDPMITVNFVYAYSALTCVGDWVFAIIPWALVWDLQMPRTQKMFVGAVLTMGAVYVSVCPTAEMYPLTVVQSIRSHDRTDSIYQLPEESRRFLICDHRGCFVVLLRNWSRYRCV